MTSTSFVFTELANTIKCGGGFLYNLIFIEWRHCVSQNKVWRRGVLYNLVFTEWPHCVSQNNLLSLYSGLRLHQTVVNTNDHDGWSAQYLVHFMFVHIAYLHTLLHRGHILSWLLIYIDILWNADNAVLKQRLWSNHDNPSKPVSNVRTGRLL